MLLSPYLDEALDLSEPARAAWLADVAQRDAALADELRALLQEHDRLNEDGFLVTGPPLPAPTSLVGQAIGDYTVVAPLGEGGMGSVWLVHRTDAPAGQQAALKLLKAAIVARAGALRFERERRILERLAHPHIARLLDAGVATTGQPYLVLEYVNGQSIDRYCDDRRLPLEARLRLVLAVLEALAHAHANLVAHRDIKPSNVLVSAAGEVKLLDFGIAKLLDGELAGGVTTLTRDGGRALTPEYAAPEQVTGAGVTTATDVYAVGVLMYVLLTGRHPAGPALSSPAELLRAIVEHEPARLSVAVARDLTAPARAAEVAAQRGTTPERLGRALRGDLETIVAKALKKAPRERYASAAALADDLRRYLDDQPIAARPDSLVYRSAKFVRRHRRTVSLAALVVMALLAGLGGTLWQARAAAHQRDLALAQLERAEDINEFTAYLLRQGVPSSQQAALLARAERLIEKRFARHAAVRADLLVTLGGIYAFRDDAGNARRVLARAHDTSRGLDDPRARAAALCAWAAASASPDAPSAEPNAQALIDSALALTTEETRFNRVVADCLVARSNLALTAGDGAGVVSAAREALQRLLRKPEDYPEARISALHFLAMGLRMQGDASASERAFAEAFERLASIGRDDTTDAALLLHNWATTGALTNPLAALARSEQALAILGSHDAEPIDLPLRINRGLLLARLGRPVEARAVQDAAHVLARQRGNSAYFVRSSVQLARACRESGALDCATASLREAALARPSLPSSHRTGAVLAREQGLLAAAQGRCEEARSLLAEALARHSAVGSEGVVAHIETLLEAAGFEARRGHEAEASGHARAALALAERWRGAVPHSAWVGLSQLRLGALQAARGESASAQRLFTQALEHMLPTLGPAHPAVAEARARLAGHAVSISAAPCAPAARLHATSGRATLQAPFSIS